MCVISVLYVMLAVIANIIKGVSNGVSIVMGQPAVQFLKRACEMAYNAFAYSRKVSHLSEVM